MRYTKSIFLALCLVCSPAFAGLDKISSAFMVCDSSSGPWVAIVIDATDSSDCDTTPSGTAHAVCQCLNGSISVVAGGTGSGTVTSVGMAVPTGFSLSGSPITTSGSFTLGLSSQSANTVWAGPTSGGSAAPTFRALVDNDIPNTITVDLATSASDLTCTNCVSGTEIDESGLGTVPTATALAANPADCSTSDGTEAAWRINASGDLSCTTIAFTSKTLDRKTSATTVNNTAAETTIYSYTIPAGTVDADGELRLTLLSEFLNNTGSNRGLTIKVKLGGTTVIEYTTGATAFSTGSIRNLAPMTVWLSAKGATNSQIVSLRWEITSNFGIFGTLTTGVGRTMTTNGSLLFVNSGTLSQDMTTSKVLEVSITLSTNSTNLEWKTYAGTLELNNP